MSATMIVVGFVILAVLGMLFPATAERIARF